MGRAPCCDKANVKRGPWSPEEDATLKRFLETHGIGGNWIALPGKAGLKRCGKSCRLRWLNYLRPDIKHGDFTEQEDNIICSLYSEMGSRWSLIASQLPGRTDNDVKNYWNTKLKKKLLAGNTSLTSKSNGDIPTYNPTPLDSTPSLPCIPTAETYNYNFDYPTSQTQISATSPLFTEVGYGLSVNDTQSLNLDPTHFSCPEIIHVSEFGVSAKNGHIGTSSQEGSSISDSTSYAMNNMCVSLPSNGGAEDAGILTDFGFGFPYDLVNGPYFQDKASEVAPSCYPNLSDFGYADINSQ